jgi:hypothetical protein
MRYISQMINLAGVGSSECRFPGFETLIDSVDDFPGQSQSLPTAWRLCSGVSHAKTWRHREARRIHPDRHRLGATPFKCAGMYQLQMFAGTVWGRRSRAVWARNLGLARYALEQSVGNDRDVRLEECDDGPTCLWRPRAAATALTHLALAERYD